MPGLPSGLEGVRIACLTDVHLAGGVSAAARVALEVLARERPDVVVLIGDICNCQSDLPTLAAWARDARGSAATFATLGNWEHTARIDRATAERAYDRAGVELLYNSVGRVSVRGATLSVVGIDDPVNGRPDPAEALKGVRTGDCVVWVLHAPGERAVRGWVVPRHVRAAVRLAGDRNDYRAGAAVLSTGASHLHSHNQTLIPTDPSLRARTARSLRMTLHVAL